MSTTEMSTRQWLEDPAMRSEYGSATFQYDIAAALVEARKMKNLTQVALANIAGVSQTYIAKLESGEANPTVGRIGAILASMWFKAQINIAPLVAPDRQEGTPSTPANLRSHSNWGTTQSTENNIPPDNTLIDATERLAGVIREARDSEIYPILARCSELGYATTGNGYYLFLKGELRV